MGPILGGVLIDAASWHWVFLINLPIGLIGLVYAYNVLPKDAPEPSESLDWVGMLMLSPGLASLLYGVSSIPGEGTVAATKVLIPMLIGVALIAAFVVWSFKPQHPLLDLRTCSPPRSSVRCSWCRRTSSRLTATRSRRQGCSSRPRASARC